MRCGEQHTTRRQNGSPKPPYCRLDFCRLFDSLKLNPEKTKANRVSAVQSTRASLLLRIRNAEDQTAWATFVEIYTPLVWGLCRRYGLQDADAADLAQEVMLTVAKAIRTFEYDSQRGSFRAWLLTVTRRKLHNFWSRQGRHPRTVTNTAILANLEASASAQEEACWDREYHRRVFEQAAGKVRKDVKDSTWQAFWQTAMENRPGIEVARNLGLNLSSVYVARKRVLDRIRAVIEEISDENLSPDEGLP